ncbi:MAG: Group 1 glycosyl transferase [Candidatus Moranbacteria bacterium GW2011_GWF2_35_39]|nr:MAG: Group 1 glycosyl transferase [Candidatus Moranbacteria bacterium GW2011_GWF2_35_39]
MDNKKNNIRILYFGIYDPDYSRNRTLIKGLSENGAKIFQIRVSPKSRFKLVKLALNFIKFRDKFDVMMVGFPGQEVVFLAKLLTRKPIVFDTFTSHYGGYILDRGKYSRNGVMAKYYRFLDKYSCKLANLCLLDTEAHIKFFMDEFGLKREKFSVVFVGTDNEIFYPMQSSSESDNFLVHFHGHFIPLQGVEKIIRAAGILKNEEITFQIIGRGQEYAKMRSLANELGITRIKWIDNVPYQDLATYINRADLCLGGFGTTEKAKHVSMNKLFEYMACGKAIITGDSPGVREFLTDGFSVIFCDRNNYKDLADKILYLKADENLISSLGGAALSDFIQYYRPITIAQNLIKDIKNIL